MTETTHTTTDETAEDFTTSEGLRALLHRLDADGPGAWQHDCTAAELMVFVVEKYAPLARKHGLDPWEATSAAFEVMRTKAARAADDPWAVITHAVRITCIFEERAQGLLCSVHQARRPHVSAFHDPERFSDRDNPLTDYHAAFQVTDDTTTAANDEDDGQGAGASSGATYHHMVMFGRSAEHAHARFAKGDNFIAEGYTRPINYERDGQNVGGEEFVAKKIGHDTARTRYDVDRTPRRAAAEREATAFEAPHRPAPAAHPSAPSL